MTDIKTYTIFVPEDDLEKFLKLEGVTLSETLIDEGTREQFQAKVIVSRTGGKDFHNLHLQGRGAFLSGDWFVKIVETEEDEDDEDFTIFESKRYGQRRGYMLRSMMAEGDKDAAKKETMTTELQKRLKQKQKIVEELLKEDKKKK